MRLSSADNIRQASEPTNRPTGAAAKGAILFRCLTAALFERRRTVALECRMANAAIAPTTFDFRLRRHLFALRNARANGATLRRPLFELRNFAQLESRVSSLEPQVSSLELRASSFEPLVAAPPDPSDGRHIAAIWQRWRACCLSLASKSNKTIKIRAPARLAEQTGELVGELVVCHLIDSGTRLPSTCLLANSRPAPFECAHCSLARRAQRSACKLCHLAPKAS